MSKVLLSNSFSIGKADTTIFVKTHKVDILTVQIYVDDIIFGATNIHLCEEFSKSMSMEFEMSMMGEPKFFLELHICFDSYVHLVHGHLPWSREFLSN